MLSSKKMDTNVEFQSVSRCQNGKDKVNLPKVIESISLKGRKACGRRWSVDS